MESVWRPLIPDTDDKQICGISYIGSKFKVTIDKKSQGQKRWMSCWQRLLPTSQPWRLQCPKLIPHSLYRLSGGLQWEMQAEP